MHVCSPLTVLFFFKIEINTRNEISLMFFIKFLDLELYLHFGGLLESSFWNSLLEWLLCQVLYFYYNFIRYWQLNIKNIFHCNLLWPWPDGKDCLPLTQSLSGRFPNNKPQMRTNVLCRDQFSFGSQKIFMMVYNY